MRRVDRGQVTGEVVWLEAVESATQSVTTGVTMAMVSKELVSDY
jgi:hypothetical protein